MLGAILILGVLLPALACMIRGCYLFLNGRSNGGAYIILSMALYASFATGVLAFSPEAQDDSAWIIFPICILICTGCIRSINGYSPVPKFTLDQRGKKVLNAVYRQIFISLVVFTVSAAISYYGFGASPVPTLQIGGTFSLITVAIPFAIGYIE